ncbi:MAG: hypothetical protein V2J10_09690 [Wenzhouxiangella sp.]|jgi:hypothetical protein|nr:hypothetical protein [Wenzhouxiangella sp.]
MIIKTPEALHSLGEDLLARMLPRIRRENFAEQSIRERAREELQLLNCDLVFDPQLWIRFIKSTNVPQKKHWFSDVPIILAHNRNLQVQLLVWTKGTTLIHSHAFCGAFRVMQGSSVHTSYSFEPEDRVSDLLYLGKLVNVGSEYLCRGSIRDISSGHQGLVHSLFHLDSPSLTLVVRTHPTTAAMPQLSYYRPGLAVDRFSMAQDEEIIHLRRLLQLEASNGSSALEAAVFDAFIGLDAPRLVFLALQFSGFLGAEQRRVRLLVFVTEHHGERLANMLDEAIQKELIQARIKEVRGTVECPELRYFLALLLNVPNRATLLGMVRERIQARDPVTACAQWIIELSELRANAQAFMQEVAARSQSSGYRLGSRIANRIPANHQLAAIEDWLRQDNGRARNPLMELPELAPLFN